MNEAAKLAPGTKVFIVEDDAFISSMLIKKFESVGAIVANDATGGSAAAAIKKDMPAIVLLDIMLPEKNGFEILQELKADPDTKGIPVIMLSNFGEKVQIDKAKQYGAANFLIKATLSIDEIVTQAAREIKTESMTRG